MFVIGGLSVVVMFEALRSRVYKSLFGMLPLCAMFFEMIYCSLMIPYVAINDPAVCKDISLMFCAVTCWLLLFFAEITTTVLDKKSFYINNYLIKLIWVMNTIFASLCLIDLKFGTSYIVKKVHILNDMNIFRMAEFSAFGNSFLLFVNICFFIFGIQLLRGGSKSDFKKKILNISIIVYLFSIIHDLSLVVFKVDDFFYQHFAFLILIVGVEIYTVLQIDEVMKRLVTAEDKLHTATLKLHKGNKLETLGLIHSQTTHEMKNIMYSIDGWAQILLKTDSKSSKALNAISKSVYHLNEIISEIQGFSKTDTVRSEIQMTELLEKLNFFAQKILLNNDVELLIDCKSEELWLNCNKTQMIQALLNLILNSCEAIANNEDRWIRLSARSMEDSIEIRIMDSGIRPANFSENSFSSRAKSTKKEGLNLGLGLDITKQIVELHYGNIIVDMKEKNTCFIIILPNKKPS